MWGGGGDVCMHLLPDPKALGVAHGALYKKYNFAIRCNFLIGCSAGIETESFLLHFPCQTPECGVPVSCNGCSRCVPLDRS